MSDQPAPFNAHIGCWGSPGCFLFWIKEDGQGGFVPHMELFQEPTERAAIRKAQAKVADLAQDSTVVRALYGPVAVEHRRGQELEGKKLVLPFSRHNRRVNGSH